MKINKELKKYIEKKIFPEYKKNDSGHNIDHINYVIERSLKFAKKIEDINIDMVYTIAAYHDIGHHIDATNHEKISGDILLADENLKEFFTDEERQIMAEAVCDHRASSSKEPRSIYGKIVSSADRITRIEDAIRMTYAYRIKHFPDSTLEEIIDDSRQHLIDKFGKMGYSNEKIYFEDLDYKKFLEDISKLANNKEKFREVFIEINKIKED